MRAASARAISSHRNAATREGLERAVAWSRQWSAEFPFCLANHLPMVSGRACIAWAQATNGWKPIATSITSRTGSFPFRNRSATITRDNWREFLGAARARSATIGRFSPARSRGLARRRPRMHLSAATHARHRGERHACVHAHGLCDDDRQRRGNRASRSPIGPRPIFRSAPREGSSPRPTIRPRFSPSCAGRRRSGMSSPSAISYGTSCARSREKPEFAPVVDMLAIGPADA